MKHPANLSHSGAKATLISVGAVVSVAAPAQADIIYVTGTPWTAAWGTTTTLTDWYVDTGIYGLEYQIAYSGAHEFQSVYIHDTKSSNSDTSDLKFAVTGANVNRYTSANIGTTVINGLTFDANNSVHVWSSTSAYATLDFRNIPLNTPTYVAFSFLLGGFTQHGWALISVSNDSHYLLTISEWAYTTAQDTITIGQTVGVPEPSETAGGLGLLALGAAGVSRYLKKRKEKAA